MIDKNCALINVLNVSIFFLHNSYSRKFQSKNSFIKIFYALKIFFTNTNIDSYHTKFHNRKASEFIYVEYLFN